MNRWPEIILLTFVILASLILMRRGRILNYPWRTALVALLLAGSGLGMWSGHLRRELAEEARRKEGLPGKNTAGGLVTSETCRSCHPQEYGSWHDSYHRQMTQEATPQSVLGDFNDVRLHTWGHEYHLTRKGDEFWVSTDDPLWEPNNPDAVGKVIDRQVVMTTGAHHYQVYWVDSVAEATRINLPFVYLREEKRWVPREYVFINPPPLGRQAGQWNNNCIQCHTTSNIPGYNEFDPKVPRESKARVGELGIACEACHGPGEAHVEHQRNLVSRYAQHFTGTPDTTIVNPARLTPERSSQVCGQCHSISVVKNYWDWLKNGYGYKAGEDLEKYKLIANPRRNFKDYYYQTYLDPDGHSMKTLFWKDGMVRVSGREYSSMRESKCNINKELECISCHSMHKSDPNDQLIGGGETDEHCYKCHPAFREKVAEHTHHAPGSPGASCYNCHMPHTTYGLLKAIRSHLIDSPSVDTTIETDRPNACNLCHLDKTIQWTADRLNEWYGQKTTLPISPSLRETATGPYYTLKGDANQRALVAWHLGWAPAMAASGQEWIAPYAIQMLDDPYHTIRFIAGKSLRSLKGFEEFVFDYTAPDAQIATEKSQAMDLWELHNRAAASKPEVLLQAGPKLDKAAYDVLLTARDKRPIQLDE